MQKNFSATLWKSFQALFPALKMVCHVAIPIGGADVEQLPELMSRSSLTLIEFIN